MGGIGEVAVAKAVVAGITDKEVIWGLALADEAFGADGDAFGSGVVAQGSWCEP